MELVKISEPKGKIGKGKIENKIELVIVKGIRICKECGTVFRDRDEKCIVCESGNCISGEIAEEISALLELGHDGFLKKYAKEKFDIKGSNKANWEVVLNILNREYPKRDLKELVRKVFWKRWPVNYALLKRRRR